ncbi:MAG TPA: hemolysin family protein [Acidobacteriota bacterium]|nr:hemolysin family protein [Acidobacteriota bacterium]
MDDITGQVLLVLVAFFLVFLNGFFVASEFSIVKVRETQIQELILGGNRLARKAQKIIGQMDEYLSATQLGITVASLGLGWIGEPAFASLFAPLFSGMGALEPVLAHSVAATLAFLLITFLHIVLGELAPKSLAIQRPEDVVLWTAAPMIWFYRLSYPFIWSLNGTANFILRTVGIRPVSPQEGAHSEEELRMILARSHEQGVLGRDEKRMLERVFDFADRSVRQVMVPSVEVVFLDVEKSYEENLKIAQQHRHTRYPLCDGSLDQVIGIIHVKDLLWNLQEVGPGFDLRTIKRPVHFVPESKFIKSLLPEFRRTQTHLAVVVDEYGSTVGIVTLEDILEELVGEIQDEFDAEIPLPMIKKTDDSHYLVHGRALLEDLEQELQVTIEDEENDTIGGHIMMQLGRTAQIGDEIILADKFRVRVVGMKGLQITDLVLEKLEATPEA